MEGSALQHALEKVVEGSREIGGVVVSKTWSFMDSIEGLLFTLFFVNLHINFA
jgi:hypothetical protein